MGKMSDERVWEQLTGSESGDVSALVRAFLIKIPNKIPKNWYSE